MRRASRRLETKPVRAGTRFFAKAWGSRVLTIPPSQTLPSLKLLCAEVIGGTGSTITAILKQGQPDPLSSALVPFGFDPSGHKRSGVLGGVDLTRTRKNQEAFEKGAAVISRLLVFEIYELREGQDQASVVHERRLVVRQASLTRGHVSVEAALTRDAVTAEAKETRVAVEAEAKTTRKETRRVIEDDGAETRREVAESRREVAELKASMKRMEAVLIRPDEPRVTRVSSRATNHLPRRLGPRVFNPRTGLDGRRRGPRAGLDRRRGPPRGGASAVRARRFDEPPPDAARGPGEQKGEGITLHPYETADGYGRRVRPSGEGYG